MINLQELKRRIQTADTVRRYGEVRSTSGQIVESKGPVCKIGDLCFVGAKKVPCEVISLGESGSVLMPLRNVKEVRVGDEVIIAKNEIRLPAPQKLLGRTLNGLGEFIDGMEPLLGAPASPMELDRDAPDPMFRERISKIIPTGVRAIDSLLTIGEGQRIGIFAGTGVGKSTLLGMIARRAKADVNVIALIGERGREVREFIERDLGEEAMRRSVLIVSTSDQLPLLNIKAAQLATSIAEEFRDQGKSVLLMMDSVTRFAMARREIDLAGGQSAYGGKTLSMEPQTQRLLERAGMGAKGSITGIYTVLVEGDDFAGAIPDIVRGTLDGHIYLSRELAQANHYPAIDPLGSVSRVMKEVVSDEHWQIANELGRHLAAYRENEDLFKIGAYVPGEFPEVDKARELYPLIRAFLRQDIGDDSEFQDTYEAMKGIVEA